MAGTIGVGSALRRAREIRGITIDEAARDTKLRVEQLHALEGEAFDELGDPVYARAMLRTYAQYLGLKPERVLSVYAKHADDVEPPDRRASSGGSSADWPPAASATTRSSCWSRRRSSSSR